MSGHGLFLLLVDSVSMPTHSCTEALLQLSFFRVFTGCFGLSKCGLTCSIGISVGTFISLLWNSLKARPCFGFVSTLAPISLVGQYVSATSF